MDTESHRLMRYSAIPTKMFAHQVIFLPATDYYPLGAVYVFGGLTTDNKSNTRNYRLDIASKKWTTLP